MPTGPVPPDLYSAHDEGPFRRCSDCGADLSSADAIHLIGRVFRDGEVIFEYALCLPCVIKLYQQYSEESKANLAAYFAQEAPPPPDCTRWCHRCGCHGEGLADEQAIEGLAMGGILLGHPIVICAECSAGAERVLSKKTREAFDDFVRRVAPMLPADVDIPSPVIAIA